MKIALYLIAACQLALTVDLYQTEEGGTAIFFGNFGYYFAAQGE
jgi:hypothetical protein